MEVTRFVPPTVENHGYYKLPDLPLTPIHEPSGLPYCFAPNPKLAEGTSRLAEWNHQYPRVEVAYGGNPIFEEELARNALLNLRHQLVDYDDHHYGYNPNYIGPMQPATHHQLAATAIMALAEYVPPMALDFSGTSPKERHLTTEERRMFQVSNQLKVACESDVVQYLHWYVFQQDVDHIYESSLDEFLHSFNLERKIHLSHEIAAKIIERAVEPIHPIYVSALQEGMLHIKTPSRRVDHPPKKPRDLVKQKIMSGNRFGRVFNELHGKLGAYNREQRAA